MYTTVTQEVLLREACRLPTQAMFGDPESQAQPVPAAPQLSVELARTTGATVAWVAAGEDAATSEWEVEWGFPVMGGWSGLPCTADSQLLLAVEPDEAADAGEEMLYARYCHATKGVRPWEWRAEVRGLDAGAVYCFRVRGINEAGVGAWSEASSRVLVRHDGVHEQDPRPALLSWLPQNLVGGSAADSGGGSGGVEARSAQRKAELQEEAAAAVELQAELARHEAAARQRGTLQQQQQQQ